MESSQQEAHALLREKVRADRAAWWREVRQIYVWGVALFIVALCVLALGAWLAIPDSTTRFDFPSLYIVVPVVAMLGAIPPAFMLAGKMPSAHGEMMNEVLGEIGALARAQSASADSPTR
ncbi:MAG: hypothetical protein E2591_27275 [Achromobacter sp.]|uniref:hypothetical protein n=1 Tax=Achromobacter sp. TaxID=134375 RepID=UPI0012CA28F0|nr:hypothetical protein [Achromobacter sp.]MPS81775.1 hypothetical protein [Achromobacter sp.]